MKRNKEHEENLGQRLVGLQSRAANRGYLRFAGCSRPCSLGGVEASTGAFRWSSRYLPERAAIFL